MAAKPARNRSSSAGAKAIKPPLADADHIYTQLKICLTKITGFKVSEIFTTDGLADKYHFTPGGQRVLAQNLESCFAGAGYTLPKPLDRDKMQAAKTVGDIADILNDSFGV